MGNSQDRQKELEFYMEHEDKIYGKGTLYSSNKLPCCYILKHVRVLTDQQQLKLFSQIEDLQNVYLIGLYGYCFAKSCECDISSMISKVVISYW